MSAGRLMDVEDLVGLPERVEEQLSGAIASCLAFNRWGTLLAAGCLNGSVALYDYQTRGMASTLEGGHPDQTAVTALLWSGDGRTLLSGGHDGGCVVAWDVASGRVRQRLQLPSAGAISHLAWACSGRGHRQQQQGPEDEVLVSREGGPAVLLRQSDGHLQQLPMVCIDGDAKQPSSSSSGSNAAGTSGQVAITSHDGAIIYAGTRGAVMVLRRADLALLDVVKVGEGGTRILGLELNNSGRRLMVTAADHHIRIFLLHRPGDRQPLREQQRLARAMCSSAANGAWSSTTASQAKAQAPGDWRVRNMEEARRAVATTATLSRSRNSVFYDNDAAWLTGLLDFAHENARRQWKCAAFSPDGEYFASAFDGGGHVVYLWEAEAEARMNAVLEGQDTRDGVLALCWHPNSTPMQLLALGTLGSVYIWAKAFTENWSAFAPDFAELTSNNEYVEPEDEFDMNPHPQDEHLQQQMEQAESNQEDEEAEDVDIGTPGSRLEEVAGQLGILPDQQLPLLHVPLLLSQLSPTKPAVGVAGARVVHATVGAAAAAAAAAMAAAQ